MATPHQQPQTPASRLNIPLVEYEHLFHDYRSLLDHQNRVEIRDDDWPTPLNTSWGLYGWAEEIAERSFLAGRWATFAE